MKAIPDDFSQRILEVFGEAGSQWLNDLPDMLLQCARRWNLSIQAPFLPLSYNYVAPAIRTDGSQVVIKLGVPNPELLTEIAALEVYDGKGIVQLLDADPKQGFLLLERLWPGTPLTSLTDDEQATTIAAQVMRQLWRPVPTDHLFPSVADWAGGLQRMRLYFEGNTVPLPPKLVELAEALFTDLLGSMAEPVLLHGDLHHDNILAAERQPWLALDPKGVVGEPAYEVGALLRNPYPQLLNRPQPGRILARRVDQLAGELGIERARITAWGLAQSVLSAWWSIEDHGYGWEYAITCAELLSELIE